MIENVIENSEERWSVTARCNFASHATIGAMHSKNAIALSGDSSQTLYVVAMIFLYQLVRDGKGAGFMD